MMVGGIGFMFISTDRRIHLVGYFQIWTNSSLQAEATALEMTLTLAEERQMEVGHVFTDYGEVADVVQNKSDIHN